MLSAPIGRCSKFRFVTSSTEIEPEFGTPCSLYWRSPSHAQGRLSVSTEVEPCARSVTPASRGNPGSDLMFDFPAALLRPRLGGSRYLKALKITCVPLGSSDINRRPPMVSGRQICFWVRPVPWLFRSYVLVNMSAWGLPHIAARQEQSRNDSGVQQFGRFGYCAWRIPKLGWGFQQSQGIQARTPLPGSYLRSRLI